MVSPKYYYYFLHVFLATSFFVKPAISDKKTQELIDKICRQMEDYAFCNNAFNQNIKGPSADIVALTQITLQQVMNNAINTHDFIVGLLRNTSDPAENKALTTCENAYRLVMGSFSEATVCFFENNYKSMLQFERPAPSEHDSCITVYNTPPYPPNPVGERNRQMRISIAMAIAAASDLTSKN